MQVVFKSTINYIYKSIFSRAYYYLLLHFPVYTQFFKIYLYIKNRISVIWVVAACPSLLQYSSSKQQSFSNHAKEPNPFNIPFCIISDHLVSLSLLSPGESLEPAEGAHQQPLSLPFRTSNLENAGTWNVSLRLQWKGVGGMLSHESLHGIFYSVKVSELGSLHSSESNTEERLNSGGSMTLPIGPWPHNKNSPLSQCGMGREGGGGGGQLT